MYFNCSSFFFASLVNVTIFRTEKFGGKMSMIALVVKIVMESMKFFGSTRGPALTSLWPSATGMRSGRRVTNTVLRWRDRECKFDACFPYWAARRNRNTPTAGNTRAGASTVNSRRDFGAIYRARSYRSLRHLRHATYRLSKYFSNAPAVNPASGRECGDRERAQRPWLRADLTEQNNHENHRKSRPPTLTALTR